MKLSPLQAIIAVLAALLVLGFLFKTKTRRAHEEVDLDGDVSFQNRESLNRIGKMLFEGQRYLSGDAKVRISLFAHELDTVYTGAPLTSIDSFIDAVGKRLNKPTAHMHVPGTYTDKVFDDMASRHGPDREAVIATDGDLDDASDAVIQKIAHDVAALAKDPSFVRLTMVGVNQENRRHWEEWLKPLGSKAAVYGPDDYEQGLDQVGK